MSVNAMPITQGQNIFPDVETVLEQEGHPAALNTTWFVTKIHSKNYPMGPCENGLRVNRAGMELLGLPWARQPEPIRPQIVAPEIQVAGANGQVQPAVVNYGGLNNRSPIASPIAQ